MIGKKNSCDEDWYYRRSKPSRQVEIIPCTDSNLQKFTPSHSTVIHTESVTRVEKHLPAARELERSDIRLPNPSWSLLSIRPFLRQIPQVVTSDNVSGFRGILRARNSWERLTIVLESDVVRKGRGSKGFSSGHTVEAMASIDGWDCTGFFERFIPVFLVPRRKWRRHRRKKPDSLIIHAPGMNQVMSWLVQTTTLDRRRRRRR